VGEDVSFELNLSDGTGPIFMDAGQFEQIFINLVVNAREALPEGGSIAVHLERVDDVDALRRRFPEVSGSAFLHLTVTDDGVGMSPEVRSRVFEPFYTTKDGGSGLGLATIHGIVLQNDGMIEVSSVEGEGSTFDVYLPIAVGKEPDRDRRAEPEDLSGGTEEILVAEDDAAVREHLVDVLTSLGYRVQACSTAEEALRQIRSAVKAPALLLSDVVMPGMSGIELARALRKEASDTRLVLMSGYAAELAGDRDPDTVGLQLLPKPIEPATLARRIREVLDG
jgi:CheY-like chemotaxis protein